MYTLCCKCRKLRVFCDIFFLPQKLGRILTNSMTASSFSAHFCKLNQSSDHYQISFCPQIVAASRAGSRLHLGVKPFLALLLLCLRRPSSSWWLMCGCAAWLFLKLSFFDSSCFLVLFTKTSLALPPLCLCRPSSSWRLIRCLCSLTVF